MARTPRLLAAALATSVFPACGGVRFPAPPALFPVKASWKAVLPDRILDPLATDGARVYAGTADGTLHAFDGASGTALWTTAVGPGAPSAVPGAVVLRREDGTVLRLDPVSGQTVWRADTGVAGSLPALVDGELVVVGGRGLVALDARSGRTAWSAPDAGTVTAPLVAADALLLVGEQDGTLRARDRETGRPLWAYATGAALHASPLLDAQGRVLLGTGARRFVALRARDGSERWRWRVGAEIRHAAAALDDLVLFVTYEDVLYCLKRGNGHMVWRAPLPSRPLSAPLLVGRAVLVACYEADLAGFDAANGARLGGLKTPAELRTAPLLLGDRLVTGHRDRSLVATSLDMSPAKPAPPSPAPGGERRGPSFP